MSQSDLNTDFYISAYVRRDLYFNQIALYPLLSRYYFGFYFSQTTSHLQTFRFYKICAQVRYLQDIVNMLVQVLK